VVAAGRWWTVRSAVPHELLQFSEGGGDVLDLPCEVGLSFFFLLCLSFLLHLNFLLFGRFFFHFLDKLFCSFDPGRNVGSGGGSRKTHFS